MDVDPGQVDDRRTQRASWTTCADTPFWHLVDHVEALRTLGERDLTLVADILNGGAPRGASAKAAVSGLDLPAWSEPFTDVAGLAAACACEASAATGHGAARPAPASGSASWTAAWRHPIHASTAGWWRAWRSSWSTASPTWCRTTARTCTAMPPPVAGSSWAWPRRWSSSRSGYSGPTCAVRARPSPPAWSGRSRTGSTCST